MMSELKWDAPRTCSVPRGYSRAKRWKGMPMEVLELWARSLHSEQLHSTRVVLDKLLTAAAQVHNGVPDRIVGPHEQTNGQSQTADYSGVSLLSLWWYLGGRAGGQLYTTCPPWIQSLNVVIRSVQLKACWGFESKRSIKRVFSMSLSYCRRKEELNQ